MNQEPPQFGVIFDMDGVLVDSANAHLRSWQALAAENGRAVTHEQFAATFGRQNRDIIPILFGDVTPQRLLELSDRKETIYRNLIRHRVPVVPGACELIHSLHAVGVRLAIGSSGPRKNINLVLDAMNVASLFSAIVSADQVTRGKPDPQVFQLACNAINLPPNRCVVIEDAPVGIAAARAAGTKTIAVLIHHAASAFPNPDLVVEKMSLLTIDGIARLME